MFNLCTRDYCHWFLVCAWVYFIPTTDCFYSFSFSCAHSKYASKMSPNSWTSTKSYTFFIIFVFALHLTATHFGFQCFCIKMYHTHSFTYSCVFDVVHGPFLSAYEIAVQVLPRFSFNLCMRTHIREWKLCVQFRQYFLDWALFLYQ